MTETTPSLSFWERADLAFSFLSIIRSALCSAITSIFRGKSGAKQYSVHVGHVIFRKMLSRLSSRQLQYIYPSTRSAYETFMKHKGLPPETVTLQHGATGHWIGNKNATNVVIYFHGGGFAVSAISGHFAFYFQILSDLNTSDHDIAIFFVSYSLTPTYTYPVQLRQSVEALRYIILETGRSPSNVIVGGDSAGGNLALTVLLHLSHPHPEIEPLDGYITSPLAGVFAFAPWVRFRTDWPSIQENQSKDLISGPVLEFWAKEYLGGFTGDVWSEPGRASLEWWMDASRYTKKVLFLAGRDEILFSGIEEFVKKFKGRRRSREGD
ncbi:hypothetical protein EYZ11_003980 [Aspergillus tanneri]|uniref:Alpha/beta hydrolase fold-3 domain-containing protein n=1 Tax=Aspergillus tanneri TaxID=1220188 RepID=A0A4S3JLS5_9EURO|nr:hypothetical protein EYZ11_003980 [Aspergillus tanneri]